MLRFLNFALLAVVLGVATWTYQIKHDADEKLAQIRALEAEIERERETIELLRADWAFLSNPSRLQALIEAYRDDLKLTPTATDQLIKHAELPDRPVFDPGDAVGDIIAGDVDVGISTSSTSGGGE
ncbi:MAG: hypothetical protein AAGG69_14170 [Pseudomonadota bacterium]